MSLQYRIAAEGQVRDVDDGKRQVLVSFPWEVIDSYQTDFERSAFDEHLRQALPIMVWQHVRSEPIGRAKEWQKTQAANEFVTGFSDFDAVPRARQAFTQIRDGELTDFSYGFDRAKSMPHPSVRGAVRFSSARMAEISPVSVGSIPGAVAIGIRAEAEVANVRGLLEAGAIDEDAANEMLRAAGLDPLPRQRVEVEVTADPLADAVREALAQHGDRDLIIRVGTDGTVSTGTDTPSASDEPDDGGADAGYDRDAVISAIDGAIDAALVYAEQLDLPNLPDAVGMVVQLLNAADVACDELMEGEGIPDYDDTTDASGRAADEDDEATRAAMAAKAVNDLPDSEFAYIEPGGETDDEGKTTPRSKRHFPIHDKAHVQNALSRAPQSEFGDKAMPKIKAAAKKLGVEVSDDTNKRDDDIELRAALALSRLNHR